MTSIQPCHFQFLFRTISAACYNQKRCQTRTIVSKYRLIPRTEFLEKFSSDRSHMLDENVNFNATPPRDDPIRNGPDNLLDFISMERGSGVGRVFEERELLDYLGVE
jgi:hypothetical protein